MDPDSLQRESWLPLKTPCYPEFLFQFISFLGMWKIHFCSFSGFASFVCVFKSASLKPSLCQTLCHLPKFSVQEQEVICLFTAGLIKTVMCRELFRRQSMRFDLESQIESHPTLAAPRRWPPRLSKTLAVVLRRFPGPGRTPSRKSCSLTSKEPQLRISGQIEAFRVRCVKGWMLRAFLVAAG